MTYNTQYFIDKFEAIPDDKWTTGKYTEGNGVCCALGHCGERESSVDSTKANALRQLFGYEPFTVSTVNDGGYPAYPQPTPKARILAALNDIKAKE